MLTDNSLTKGACLTHYRSPQKLGEGTRLTCTDLSMNVARLSRNYKPKADGFDGAAWNKDVWPVATSTMDIDFVNDRGFVKGYGQGRSMDALTYTRNSAANYVGSDGLLKTSNVNLFANSGLVNTWTSLGLSLSFSQTAPDGTNTAVLGTDQIGNSTHAWNTSSSINTGSPITFSCYAKQGTQKYFAISIYFGGSNIWVATNVDLNAGVITTNAAGTLGGNYLSSSIINVGSGWYRISVTGNASSGVTATGYMSLSNSATPTFGAVSGITYNGTGTNSVYVWGAQLEQSNVLTSYQANYGTVNYNPRFDQSSLSILNFNYLTYTQQFDNGIWFKVASSITADQTTAPDGTNTADLLTDTTANSQHGIFYLQSGTYNQTYTFSCYLKANSLGFGFINVNGNTSPTSAYGVVVNLNTGAITATSKFDNANYFSTISSNVTSAGSGWYRVSITFQVNYNVGFYPPIVNTSNMTFYIGASNSGTPSFTGSSLPLYIGTGTGTIYIWGAQLEKNASATVYKGLAGWAYQTLLNANSVSNGLLIEEARQNAILWCRDATNGSVTKNYLLQSQVFNLGNWSLANVSVTANSTTDPLGGSTASTITDTGTNTTKSIFQLSNSTAVGLPYTCSIYLKAGTVQYGFLQIAVNSGAAAYRYTAVVDLNAGVVTTTAQGASVTGVSNSITSVGAGWYRVTVTATNSSTTNAGGIYLVVGLSNSGTPVFDSNSVPTYTGTGTGTIYIWGAQLEQAGAATAYEATTTRAFNWVKTNMTTALTQTGIDGVANSATLLTATANNATLAQTAAQASANRIYSVYLKRVSGSGDVRVTLDGTNYINVDLSSGSWNRVNVTITIANPNPIILIATNGDSIAMDYAQIESNATYVNSTTPILTNSQATTRAQDTCALSSTYFPQVYNQTQGTFQISFTTNIGGTYGSPIGFVGSTNGDFLGVNNGGYNSTFQVFNAPGVGTTFSGYVGNLNYQLYSDIKNVTVSYINETTASFGYQGTYYRPTGATPTSTCVVNVTSLTFGNRQGGTQFLSGCIRRVVYTPKFMTDAAILNP